MTFRFKDISNATEFVRLLVWNNYIVTKVWRYGASDYRVQVKCDD